MDSKMDSGYLGPGENQAHALEDDYDVTRELSPEEVLGVMDELVCHEVCFISRDFTHVGNCLLRSVVVIV